MTEQPGVVQRISWLDTAKGIAIILVVIGHAMPSLIFANILQESRLTQFVYSWIYSFHMPVFFFIAGVFFLRSTRRSTTSFLVNKLKIIAYPYFLWSLIQAISETLLTGYTTGTHPFPSLVDLFLRPNAQFWFLYSLFIMYVVFIAAYKLHIPPNWYLPLSIAFMIFIRVATNDLALPDSFYAYVVNQTLLGAIYFSLGIIFGTTILTRLPQLKNMSLAIISCLLYLAVTAFVLAGFYSDTTWLLIFPGVLGILATLSLSNLLWRARDKVVSYCGLKSMQIYLMSMLGSSGVRIALDKFLHLKLDWWIYLIIMVLMGITIPLLVDILVSRVGFQYAFTIPSKPSSNNVAERQALA